MCYRDFLSNWHTVQICHLSADSFSGSIAEGNQVIQKHELLVSFSFLIKIL